MRIVRQQEGQEKWWDTRSERTEGSNNTGVQGGEKKEDRHGKSPWFEALVTVWGTPQAGQLVRFVFVDGSGIKAHVT